jgi:hypothetical protein
MTGVFKLGAEHEHNKGQELKMIKQFHVFFVAQVKQLLFENEQRSVRLEKNIHDNKISNPEFNQLLRVLQDENSVVIKRFCDMLWNRRGWKELNVEDEKLPPLTNPDNPIVKLLSEPDVRQHQLYSSLKLFFRESETGLGEVPPEMNPLFLNFLELQHFLQFEEYSSKTIIEKTRFIFERIKNMIEFKAPSEPVMQKTGVFLLVKNYRQELTLVDELYEDIPLLEQYFWLNKDEQYLLDFLDGRSDPFLSHRRTIRELYHQKDAKNWQDLYSIKPEEKVAGLSTQFLSEYLNHLILIRLNRRDMEGDSGLGLLGIYFEKDKQVITNINRVRYLLLLRDPLIAFVEKHHRSNEFLELQEAAQAKRMVLLAGHGREMILNLAVIYKDVNGGIFGNIAAHLGQIQDIMSVLRFSYFKKAYEAMLINFYNNYHNRGIVRVNSAFVNRIYQLAKDIYSYPEIETKVNMDTVFSGDIINFAFDTNLLEIICFELLVNAKKNRWHFLDGCPIQDGFIMNKLVIHFTNTEDGRLKLVIANTGPQPARGKMSELQIESRDGKPPNLTSGTRLIKHIVSGILKDEINFKAEPYGKQENGVCLFSIEITLRSMSANETKKDFINRKPIHSF